MYIHFNKQASQIMGILNDSARVDNSSTKLCLMYWLPDVANKKVSFSGFIDDFSTHFEHLTHRRDIHCW